MSLELQLNTLNWVDIIMNPKIVIHYPMEVQPLQGIQGIKFPQTSVTLNKTELRIDNGWINGWIVTQLEQV